MANNNITYTGNYNLATVALDQDEVKFGDFRNVIAGVNNSNMQKIDTAIKNVDNKANVIQGTANTNSGAIDGIKLNIQNIEDDIDDIDARVTTLEQSGGGGTGVDGRTPELRTSGGYIQWRYVGDTAWINLIALSELKGADGIDGKSVELQTANGYIQWRQTGGAWNNLISLDNLKGEKGDKGDFADIAVNGILKGISGTLVAAIAGTDYATPDDITTAIQSAIIDSWEGAY